MKRIKLNYLMLIILALLAKSATAYDFEVDGIYYDINGTEVTVTEGDNKYTGDVTIPESVIYGGTTYPVTSVGYFCDWPDVKGQPFAYCTQLRSVTLPKTITVIGNGAFAFSASLNNIVIPNSVVTIGVSAFEGCTGLTNVTIPNSVTTIADFAYAGCSELTSIDINGSPYMGNGAFEGCNSITKVNISSISAWCGVHCNDPSGNPLFYAKHLYLNGEDVVDLVIPDNVIHIGQLAFINCEGFRSVTIPRSITKIEGGAFWGCAKLEYVNIIDIGAWCAINFEYLATGPYEDMIDWMNDAANPLAYAHHLYQNGKEIQHIIIPDSTTYISQFAFTRCSSITSVTIPNTVTSINDFAFYHCSNLTSIIIPNSVQRIGYGSFLGCNNMTSIEIGKAVLDIDKYAFRACDKVSSVTCYSAIPPTCGDDTFSNYYNTLANYSAALHVPAASFAAYFTAPCWENFENIIGDAVAPTGISISNDNVEMSIGNQFQLAATVTPDNASNKNVTWWSTDTTVATVNDGTVTSIDYGECDVIASCFGMQAVCHISVVNRISLDQQEAHLLPNHMLTLMPSAPAMPNGFTVTSSDPTVAAARVMNGKVQVVGIKEGTTTITVGSADGTAIPATCLVTVYTEPGDLNSDGFINISDVTSLIDYLLGNEYSQISSKNADVNGDDNINIADVTTLIDQLLTSNQ